jgi:hypothetical protein
VVDRPGEHPSELRAANPRFERREALLRFDDGRFVVLRCAELEEDLRVVDVARELRVRVERLLDPGALAVDRLRLPRVLPETRGERLRV